MPIVDNQQPRFICEPLTEFHDTSRFICEDISLTEFIQDKAIESDAEDSTKTYVLVDRNPPDGLSIVGYFSISAGTNHYAPVVYLNYLARHQDRLGSRLGTVLLYHVFKLTASIAEHIGITGIMLEATRMGRKLYERYGFLKHPYGGAFLFLPIASVRQALQTLPTDLP